MGTIYVDEIKHQSAQGSGTITLGASGETVAIAAGATASGFGGITSTSQYRLTTNFDIPNSRTTITGWELSDEPSYGGIGTAMTESSGIFTFPSTGIWLVKFTYNIASSDYAATNAAAYIEATIDNSTYNDVSIGWIGYEAAGGNPPSRLDGYCEAIIDVTSTSNVKVRFSGIDNDNVTIAFEGNTNLNSTAIVFVRLGDT